MSESLLVSFFDPPQNGQKRASEQTRHDLAPHSRSIRGIRRGTVLHEGRGIVLPKQIEWRLTPKDDGEPTQKEVCVVRIPSSGVAWEAKGGTPKGDRVP